MQLDRTDPTVLTKSRFQQEDIKLTWELTQWGYSFFSRLFEYK